MATQSDVRRLALELPGAVEHNTGFGVVHPGRGSKPGKTKGFAWVWLERVEPKKPRVPQPKVLAVRTADLDEKAALLAADPETFFTEPHYNNYPAVLVRLTKIKLAALREVLFQAWRCTAPATLLNDEAPERSKPAKAAKSPGPATVPAPRARRVR